MNKTIVALLVLVSALLAPLVAQTKLASGYPARPIEIICPFPVGGGQDIAARILAKYAEKYIGQRIIVTNLVGGSGVVGHTAIADAKPDGYKLGCINSFTLVDRYVIKGVPYSAACFVPLVLFADDPYIIVARKGLKVNTMKDFIALAGRKAGSLTFGAGNWNGQDWVRFLLEEKTAVSFAKMPFQGGAPAIVAVAGENCDSTGPFVAEALAQIETKGVVPLAITSEKRAAIVKDVPTLKESGIDMAFTMWRAISVPPGTSKDIIDFLAAVFEKAYNDPMFQDDAVKAGLFPRFMGPVEFKAYYDSTLNGFEALVRKYDIKVQ